MVTIILLLLLVLVYALCVSRIDKVNEETDWPQKLIKDRINDHFKQETCTHVTIDPIGFIYSNFMPEESESNDSAYLIKVTIKTNLITKEFTTLVSFLDTQHIMAAGDKLIKEIEVYLVGLHTYGV